MHMAFKFPPLALVWRTALFLVLGGLGGYAASLIRLPMPWMLGSLFVSAVMVLTVRPRVLEDYTFPPPLRTFFIALIGVMIGTQVTPELWDMAGDLGLSFLCLIFFVVAAHAGNYQIFRRVGGMDRATAFYSGTPGGLIESIVTGEAAGADIRILTVQQFLRIIVVITTLPLALSLWVGEPVGSAAGILSPNASEPVGPLAIGMIVMIAVAGMALGGPLRLPAARLTGPLLLAGGLTVTGVLHTHLPGWLIAAAQCVIGVSLGLRFHGVKLDLLRRSLGLSLLSVAYMLVLGGAIAMLLHAVTGIPFLHLLISYAPGGVAEMSVIALSLAANPALVSLHHVIRILLTVVEMPLAARVTGIAAKR